MLDDRKFASYPRRPQHHSFELGQIAGWVLCSLAVVYLFTAALLGLLAT